MHAAVVVFVFVVFLDQSMVCVCVCVCVYHIQTWRAHEAIHFERHHSSG